MGREHRATPANPLAPAVKHEGTDGTKRRGTGAGKTCLEPRASPRLKSPPPRDTPCLATASGTKGSSWAAAEPLECTDVGSFGFVKAGARQQDNPYFSYDGGTQKLRAYILACRTAPGVSLRATMGVPLRARTALLPAWALGPELARSQPRGLPAPALGSSGAAVVARRRPLSRTGFVLLGILVAGHRETSCRDARGQSRLASACPHRASGPTFVLFPAATHRRAGRLGLWPRRLPGLEGRPAPEEGLLLVCARPSRLDSSYRPSSPLMFWSFLMLYSFVRNQVLWLPAPSCCFRKKRGSWGWHHTQLVLFLLSRPRPARCTTLGRSNGTREPWQLGEGTDLG